MGAVRALGIRSGAIVDSPAHASSCALAEWVKNGNEGETPMTTYALTLFGQPLSYGELALIAVALALLVLLWIVLGWLADTMRQDRARKAKEAMWAAMDALGYPNVTLTDEQLARITGHNSADWFSSQNDWRKP